MITFRISFYTYHALTDFKVLPVLNLKKNLLAWATQANDGI
jgi:hypothetical protein